MALVPWTDDQKRSFVSMQYAAQQDHYGQKYPDATHDIVMSGDRPVGQLYVARLENEIRIVDLIVAPEERNAGIGSELINRLVDEARRTDKILIVFVESFNPSLSLFQRLGFVAADEQGAHLIMQRKPDAGSNQTVQE